MALSSEQFKACADTLREHFSQSELARLLQRELDCRYGQIVSHGSTFVDAIDQVVNYFDRRNVVPKLMDAAASERPNSPALQTLAQRVNKDASISVAPERMQRVAVNPFVSNGRLNKVEQFVGRQRQLREIRAELCKRSHISLIGESQIGKSSLLYHLYLTREAWLPDTLFVYIDLQRIFDEADFCGEVLAALGKEGATLRELRRVLQHRDMILLLDEMERFADADFTLKLLNLLRSLAQGPHIALIVASQLPLVELFPDNDPKKTSPFHNIFTQKRLGPFTEVEANTLLQTYLDPTPIRFTAQQIEGLCLQSTCHPARLQANAHQLFDEINDGLG